MRTLWMSLLLLVPLHPAAAQWRLTVLHGTAAVSGYSRDESSPDHPSFLPDRPTSDIVAIGRDLGHGRLTVELRRTSADLTLRGPGTAIVTRGALHAWGAGVEGARRLAGVAGRPTLHAGLGLLVERWDFAVDANGARWRVAGRGALEVGLPITRRWQGVVRGEVTASPSVFAAEELPGGYVRRLGWRRGMEIGVGWRW